MDELDVMKRDKDRILSNWRQRCEDEQGANFNQRHDITITLTTLEWFLWMIECVKK